MANSNVRQPRSAVLFVFAFLAKRPKRDCFLLLSFHALVLDLFCPQARDDCVVMNGEDKCSELIEAHKACLRAEGFDIR